MDQTMKKQIQGAKEFSLKTFVMAHELTNMNINKENAIDMKCSG